MMNESKIAYVFDTSAWLTLIEDEAGADVVESLLESANAGSVEIFVSFMSFMEVFYITLQERDIEEAEARLSLMASLPIARAYSSEIVQLFRSYPSTRSEGNRPLVPKQTVH